MEMVENQNSLQKYFFDIVGGIQIHLDEPIITQIIKKDLLIKLESVSDNLCGLLTRMFVFYVKTWPGWNKSKDYFNGILTQDVWYERFKQYLIVKLNYIVKNGYNEAMKLMKKESSKVEHGTQTDNLAPKGYAPFSLHITCNSEMMNTLVFTTSEEHPENLILRTHPPSSWSFISLSQLLNWPFVEIYFQSPELMFSRKNVTEYNRYISLTSCPLRHDKEDFIESVDFINEKNKKSETYTLRFLEAYCNEYTNILTNLSKRNVSLDTDILSDMKIVLNEFLMDIKDLNINKGCMATNAKVTFNVGKSNYVRVKKLTKGGVNATSMRSEVGYCEFITPKVQLSLDYFKGVQDKSRPGVSFNYLNNLKRINSEKDISVSLVIPKISFRCNFCDKNLDTRSLVFQHFCEFHKFEQNVVCYKCKQSFPLPVITKLRWNHNCKCASTTMGTAKKK